MRDIVGLEMSKTYGAVLQELYDEFPDEIFVMEADLSSSMGTIGLKDTLGDHYVNVGIAEAQMTSAAAGINLAGGFAFAHSFGQFVTRRTMDQLFVSLAYARLSACIVGSDSGVIAQYNGGTHMTFEDMGIVRVTPGIYVYDVSDSTQFAAMLRKAYERKGVTYIRTIRSKPPRDLYGDAPAFGEEGARIVRPGTDISILACGLEVDQALGAADLLAEEGVSAEVLDVFRVKPLDAEVILSSIGRTGCVVTAENHNVINGLGSAVGELLLENLPVPGYRIGAREKFGQVGYLPYLLEDYRLRAVDIAEAVRGVLARV